MKYKIVHKKEGWVACYTYSKERAKVWLDNFNPELYVYKTLTKEDFKVISSGLVKH